MKIVSGGQTGVDRGALDAAIAQGASAGGWCPQGRMAEDGAIPESYPLSELHGAGYLERTRQNVIDSDGTVIIYFSYPSGGTEQTLKFCVEEGRPYVLIDADEIPVGRAAEKIIEFIADRSISVLNVAGPRASGEQRAYEYARSVITLLLKKLYREHACRNLPGTR